MKAVSQIPDFCKEKNFYLQGINYSLVMNRILLLLFICFFTYEASAQRTAVISSSLGVVHYVGDLANEKYFPFSSANVGSAITIRDFLNNPKKTGTKFPIFDAQLRFSWHRLQYDETAPLGGNAGNELRNYKRGLSFRNDLFGIETDFTYNFYINQFAPLSKLKMSFFLLGGVGMFYGEPKADLFYGNATPSNRYYFWNDGTVHNGPENGRGSQEIQRDGIYETNLRDWHTEGQGYSPEGKHFNTYSNFNIGFPVGGGMRYFYNKYLTFSAEVNYYFFITDYLDDVSDVYATYDELNAMFTDPAQNEMARYISDPSGKGTNGNLTTASRRGNPAMMDAFSYISIEAAYKFTWKKKGIYGQ